MKVAIWGDGECLFDMGSVGLAQNSEIKIKQYYFHNIHYYSHHQIKNEYVRKVSYKCTDPVH